MGVSEKSMSNWRLMKFDFWRLIANWNLFVKEEEFVINETNSFLAIIPYHLFIKRCRCFPISITNPKVSHHILHLPLIMMMTQMSIVCCIWHSFLCTIRWKTLQLPFSHVTSFSKVFQFQTNKKTPKTLFVIKFGTINQKNQKRSFVHWMASMIIVFSKITITT